LDEENFEIFMKPLANGDTAICLFNRSDDKMNVTINGADYMIANNFFNQRCMDAQTSSHNSCSIYCKYCKTRCGVVALA
jgi:hypothetical protein